MLPQRLRTWTWRANGLLAVAVLVVWGHALAARTDARAPLRPEPAHAAARERVLRASATLEEIQAEARPFHGWGERAAPERHEAPPPPSGRLPLGALAWRAWIRVPDGPDLVVLKSKDPAHPELYLPEEGAADDDIEIAWIDRASVPPRLAVRRGEEQCTYELLDGRGPPPGRMRNVRPVHASAVSTGGPGQRGEPGGANVKLVPFYGEGGALLGARVTGVKPGSRLEALGLARGDVVVGLGPDRVVSVEEVREELQGEGALQVEVLRGTGREAKRLRLGG